MLLGEQLERALLGGIASLGKPGKRLLAGGVGLAAHNAAFVHHQILLVEAAGRVLRRAVPDLDTRTNRGDISTTLVHGHHSVRFGGHFLYIGMLIFASKEFELALLRCVASLSQTLECLLTSRCLLETHHLAALV